MIENLLDPMPKYLLMGKNVSIDEFGMLRLSFSNDGVENDDFSASLISGVKVVFTPCVEQKKPFNI